MQQCRPFQGLSCAQYTRQQPKWLQAIKCTGEPEKALLKQQQKSDAKRRHIVSTVDEAPQAEFRQQRPGHAVLGQLSPNLPVEHNLVPRSRDGVT